MSGFFGVGIGPYPIGRTGTPADPVPVLGSELIVNGGFEGTYTAGVAPNWTISGAPTVAESAVVHAGTAAQSITSPLSADRINHAEFTVPSIGWYQFSVWSKTASGTGTGYNYLSGRFGGGTLTFALTSSYTEFVNIVRSVSAGSGTGGALRGHTTESIFDDYSVKLLALSSLLSTRSYPSADCDISAAVTRTSGTQAGFVARLDSATTPANFLIAYLDGAGNVKVDKCVSGTYTNVISGAITYGATKRLRLVCSGTSVSAYYDGTQVGSTVTVSDAGIVSNVLHGKFSTYASNTMAGFVAA